jgi:hypothetical protein
MDCDNVWGSSFGTDLSEKHLYYMFRVEGKVKGYTIADLDRSLGFQEVGEPRICTHSAHEGGKVSRTHRPPLPHRRYF